MQVEIDDPWKYSSYTTPDTKKKKKNSSPLTPKKKKKTPYPPPKKKKKKNSLRTNSFGRVLPFFSADRLLEGDRCQPLCHAARQRQRKKKYWYHSKRIRATRPQREWAQFDAVTQRTNTTVAALKTSMRATHGQGKKSLGHTVTGDHSTCRTKYF